MMVTNAVKVLGSYVRALIRLDALRVPREERDRDVYRSREGALEAL
jgi:hypothetical protein